MTSGATPLVQLVVADDALARLATFTANDVPGVARLHPTPGQAAKHAARRLASARRRRGPAPAADLTRDAAGVTVTLRVTSRTDPPVVRVVDALQLRIGAVLADIARGPVTVAVQVVDVED